jgi:hypothetical protein
MPFGRVEIRPKELFPMLFPHAQQANGAGFRESTPKTLNRLKTFAWINRN